MSSSIDERIVSMQFDNSKFESNAQQTMSTLDKLKSALKFDKASDGLESVSKAAGNIKLDGIGSACETVSNKFSALQVAAITALANITNDAVNAGKKIVAALTIDGAKDGFAEYEQKMGSVQTIMNGTGESLETVMGYLEELNQYADKTIYSFSDMTSSIGKFTNAGVDLKTAVASIQGISNATALAGGSADKASIAMYNFAQALSIGYVGLTDWKSIELAQIGTVEFREEVLEAAVALGTLKKSADGTYSTIEKGTNVTVENMRNTLNEQWFTSEVLTTVLSKYADQTTELGQRATEAATKVKTFSMMIDTLKESVGSGWAVTWEKLIGNFNQSSEFFTDVTNELSELISAQADARNQLLDAALNKGDAVKDINDWTKLAQTVRNAGGDVGQFQDVIIETARTHGIEIDKMIEEAGSFSESLKSGWLSGDLLNDAIAQAEALGNLSPEFAALAKAVSLTNKPFRELADQITEVSGRTHLLNGIKNIFEAIKSVVTPLKEAFREVFPAKTADDLRNALGSFEEFTQKLILTDDAAERVKTTFQGFFTVIKKGLDTIKSIAQAFSPLKDIFMILVENLLRGAEELGKFFNTLDDGESSVSGFQKVLNLIHDALQKFANNLQGYIDKAVDAFKKLKDMISQSWDTGALSVVAGGIEKIKNSLSGFTGNAAQGIKTFFQSLNFDFDGSGLDKVTSVLTKFGEGIGKVAQTIGSLIQPIIDHLKNFFSELDIIDSMAVAIEAGGISAVVAFLGRMADTILDFAGQVKSLASAMGEGNPVKLIEDVITGIADTLGSIEDKFRSDVIANFAKSVGILAASIYVLASIDADAAKQAVKTITGLLVEVMGVFELLNKTNFGSINTKNGLGGALTSFASNMAKNASLSSASTTIMKIAASVLILAAAMKMIAELETGQIVASFTAISLLLGELTGVALILSKKQAQLSVGAGQLIALAASVIILSAAMKMLADLEIPQLIASGIALTVIIGELVTVCKLLDGVKGMTGAGSMIALAAAIMILAVAMKMIGDMSIEQISAGLFTIAGLLLELGVALKLMPEALPGAAALLVASAAILVLAGALKVMESIDSGSILPILGLLGGVLLELSVALTAMLVALPGAAALLVAAAAIAVLVPALIALSAVDPKKAFTAIGELAVALIAIGGVSAVLGIVSPLILAFAAALLVLSAALLGIGASLALAGAGLTAISASFGILSEVSKESAERFVDTLQIILNGIITLIPNAVRAFGEGIIQICDVIVAGAPSIKAAIATIVDILVTVFSEKIPQLTEAFAQFLLALVQQMAEYAPQIQDACFQMIEGLLQVINEHLPTLIQAGVDIMTSFIEGIQSATNQLVDAAMQAIIAFIDGLATSIETHTPELIQAVNHLFDAVINAALLILSNGNPQFVIKARELMNSFKTGINDRINEIRQAIVKMVNDMIQAVTTKVGEFRNAASQLIEGFIQGVQEKVSAAVEAVKGLGQKAVEGLKSVLNIHSPSRVAAEIGRYFGEGFSQGVDEETSSATSSTERLGNSAADAMDKAVTAMLARIKAKSAEFKQAGTSMMTAFANGIQQAIPQMDVPVNGMLQKITQAIENYKPKAQLAMKQVLEQMLTTIRSYYYQFYNEGFMVMGRFGDGLNSRSYYVRNCITQVIAQCTSEIRNSYSEFYSAGAYAAEGFTAGIESQISAAAAKAAALAQAASQAAKANLKIASPSRVFKEIGAYVGEGFVIGMSEYEGKSAMGGAALAMRAVAAANEILDDGIDTNPVITPVIDLSEIEEGTRQLGTMLSRNQALSINASMNQNGTNVERTSNGSTTQVQNINYTQNNYSPKALSRTEIYRQTNNQLSRMRGALA